MTLCPQLRRLSAEHARWRSEIEWGAGEATGERAARLLALWEAEILPHCRAEEEVLLPELARRLSEADATIVFTLGDHVALRSLARQLRTSQGTERAATLAQLGRKLAEHADFEERTLFPVLQETLGCEGLAALATEIARTVKDEMHRPAGSPPAAHEATNGRNRRKP